MTKIKLITILISILFQYFLLKAQKPLQHYYCHCWNFQHCVEYISTLDDFKKHVIFMSLYPRLSSRCAYCCSRIMFFISNTIYYDKIEDADIEGWSLQSTLTGCFSTLAIYLLLVLKILPRFMKNRPPFQLKKILLVYNTFQVFYSLYLVLLYVKYMSQHGVIVTRCSTDKQVQLEIISDIRPYFLAKYIDLLDTVFFVLRKKQEQVTFLHSYHHCVMVTWQWLHLFYHPNDQFVFVGFLNSLVHVLMYAYYGIASLGPKYQKYVWWKKHLTKIQLVQFIMVVLQLHYQHEWSPCKIPAFFHWFCLLNISFFFVLFLKFYFRSYNKKNT